MSAVACRFPDRRGGWKVTDHKAGGRGRARGPGPGLAVGLVTGGHRSGQAFSVNDLLVGVLDLGVRGPLTLQQECRKRSCGDEWAWLCADKLYRLNLSEQLMQLYSARQRRRLNRGLRRKQHSLLKRLRKAKKEAPPMEKPEVVKTHLRDMIILPEMVGSMVGVYNGKTFNQVEIKPEMIGHYLGEFSITYKPVKHGRPGIGATHSSRFIPLK
nr:40S ribosomal protein S15 [Loxodonta africana]